MCEIFVYAKGNS